MRLGLDSATLDYQPRNATNERIGVWQNQGKGSTRFILSFPVCVSGRKSVFTGDSLTKEFMDFLLASHLNILTYCKPPWQNSSAKDSSSALGLCLATFKCNNNIKTGSVYPFLKSVLTFRLVPGCLLTHILNSSVFILRFTLINADILIKRRFSCQCKPSPDVYGNNLSLVGWVWHLMFHVPTCFHASLIRLRLWNIAGFGVR